MTRNSTRLAAAATMLAALLIADAAAQRFTARPGSATARAGDGRADFMRRVYEAQVKRALTSRRPFAGLPQDQLETVEGGHRMRRDAAAQCRLLLRQAKSDLRREKAEGGRQALEVSDIGVHSAYRSVEDDAAAWHSTFRKHLKATKNARAALRGGEYGDEAVAMMVTIMRRLKAPPGFSKHTSGVAVDFTTTEGKVTLAADSNHNRRWKGTWFHAWLVRNARRFNFKPLATEAWHWEYTGERAGRAVNARSGQVD